MLSIPFAIKVFMAMFAIMNPVANIPVFLSFTQGTPVVAQRKAAAKVSLGVITGCVLSAVAGGPLLHVFGLQVDDFRLAGGLLVLLIALSMLNGGTSTQHSPTEDESQAITRLDNVVVYPLTIPLLVGPGTIATLIVLGHTAGKEGLEISMTLGLGAFLAVMTTALLMAPTLAKYLSSKVTAITQRLMGMILAAIAMEMMIQSLQHFFPKLT